MSGKWHTTATIDPPSRKKDATTGRFIFIALREFRCTQEYACPSHENFFLDEVAILIHAVTGL
jgi:hypothetical protein